MDINFTEYDNFSSNDNLNQLSTDYASYWEQPKTEKKKKVSFNDILSNMNIVVGKNGVLQQMRNQVEEPLPPVEQLRRSNPHASLVVQLRETREVK